MSQTVSISFYRYDRFVDQCWAFSMMAWARRPLSRVPGIGFWKLCGSGHDEGFTPTLWPHTFAILATWPDAQTARARTEDAQIFDRYRARANESWTVFLTPTTARGNWSGAEPFEVQPEADGPLAALTRATIKPGILSRFWGRVPDISTIIGGDPNVTFKIGIGEVPMLQQVTFSIWPSKAAMDGFARTGAHAAAIRAVRDEGWFKEELYARFAVQSDRGTWGGSSPLDRLEHT